MIQKEYWYPEVILLSREIQGVGWPSDTIIHKNKILDIVRYYKL